MAIIQCASIGDSLTQGTVDNASTYQGGAGCWLEFLAERFANRHDLGPLLSPGLRQVHLISSADNEWVRTGSLWTQTTTSNAFDRAPFGRAFYSNLGTDRERWIYKSQWRPIVGFAVYWIDYFFDSGNNAGNWQYSLDNANTWTNMNQTIAHDNLLKKFYVASPITNNIYFRPSDGTSDVGCLIVGIEPFFIDPRTVNRGFIWHNLGSGAQKLVSNLLPNTAGDRLAFLDDVRLGTGSPIPNTPSFVTSMFINDVNDSNTTTWGNALTTVHNRVSPYANLLLINPYEADPVFYDTTDQTNYRAKTKTVGAANGDRVFDIYDAWNGIGITGNDEASTQGFLFDNTHETPEGHYDIQERLYRFIQSNYFPVTAYDDAFATGWSTTGESDVVSGIPRHVTAGIGQIPIVNAQAP